MATQTQKTAWIQDTLQSKDWIQVSPGDDCVVNMYAAQPWADIDAAFCVAYHNQGGCIWHLCQGSDQFMTAQDWAAMAKVVENE